MFCSMLTQWFAVVFDAWVLRRPPYPLPGGRARAIPVGEEKEGFEVVKNIGKWCRFNFVVYVDDFTITNPDYFNESVGFSHA